MTHAAVLAVCTLAVLALCASAILHEDDVGKRDWYLPGLGRVEKAAFISTPTTKQTVVTTAEGVVAAISTLDKGALRWRHLLGAPQVCLSASPASTVVLAASGTGHVLHSVTGALQATFRVKLDGGATVSDCSFDHDNNVVLVAAVESSSVHLFSFKADDTDLFAVGPIERVKLFETASAVTKAMFAGHVNLWVERNGTGVDVVDLSTRALTATDVKGWVDAASPSGDALLSFYKEGAKSCDAGRMVRIMSAVDTVVKAVDGKKGSSCKECRTGLSIMEETKKKPLTGDVVIAIRENPDSFFLHVASRRYVVAYPGYYPPRIIAARQTAKKADILVRSSNNHLMLVVVSLENEEASIAWERFEGLSSPAQVKIVPLAPLSTAAVEAAEGKDLFGFNVDAMVLSNYGTLYRVPVVNKGQQVVVVADISDSIRKALNVPYVCGAQYKDMVIDNEGVATIAVVYQGKTLVASVEIATGQVLRVSTPVEAATYTSASKVLDASFVVTSAETRAETQFLYTVAHTTGAVKGLRIAPQATTATPTWEVNFGRPIVAVATPNDRLSVTSTENIRIFPNTSKVNEVRRKYPTNNILVVATMNEEEEQLYVTVLDTITGSVLATAQHNDVRGAIHILIVEHVVVYHFLNTDRMRYSLGILELFEQEDIVISDASAATPAQAIASFFVSQKTFSATTARPPVVASMVLAFPGGALSALGVTTSYLGINRKQIIFAMADGHVHAVDLRAVCFGGQVNPQKPEEVYQHVNLPSINIISHMVSVAQPKIVASTPTELESSSHVMVAGLDLFYARVSAGKAFDTLNDDFNHRLLVAVCGGMGVLTVVARFFSSRKALKMAWA